MLSGCISLLAAGQAGRDPGGDRSSGYSDHSGNGAGNCHQGQVFCQWRHRLYLQENFAICGNPSGLRPESGNDREGGDDFLPVIISTITTSLVVAILMYRLLKIPGKTAALIGVGSCICGGSAIA